MDCSELQFYQKLLSDERISRIETILERRTRWITLALENIHHKHNLNAAIRSCEALGIQDVYIADQEEEFESCNGVHMGCDKWLTQHDFHGKDASSKCITKLKDNGYRVIALSPHNPTIEWKELQINQKTAFFIGAELNGLSKEVLENADERLALPMYGFSESYNLSVTAALILFEARQKLLNLNSKDTLLSENEKRELRLEWSKKSVKHLDRYQREFSRHKKI